MDFSMDQDQAVPVSNPPRTAGLSLKRSNADLNSPFSGYNGGSSGAGTPLLTPNTMLAMGVNPKRKRGFEGDEEGDMGMGPEGTGNEEGNKQPRIKSPEMQQYSTFDHANYSASASSSSGPTNNPNGMASTMDDNGFINGGGRQSGYMLTSDGMAGANAGFAAGWQVANDAGNGTGQFDYFAQHAHHRSARRPSTIETPVSDMSMANTPFEAPIDSPWYPAGGGAVPLATPGLSAALAQTNTSGNVQPQSINPYPSNGNDSGYPSHAVLPEDPANGLPFQASALSAQPFSSTLGAPPTRVGLMQPGFQQYGQQQGSNAPGQDGMEVEAGEADLAGLVAAARNVHGPQCTTIPQLRLSDHPDPATGTRSMWSICSSCGSCERMS